jgi:hypothetical protein
VRPAPSLGSTLPSWLTLAQTLVLRQLDTSCTIPCLLALLKSLCTTHTSRYQHAHAATLQAAGGAGS